MKKRYVQKVPLITWKMSLNEKIVKWAECSTTKIIEKRKPKIQVKNYEIKKAISEKKNNIL